MDVQLWRALAVWLGVIQLWWALAVWVGVIQLWRVLAVWLGGIQLWWALGWNGSTSLPRAIPSRELPGILFMQSRSIWR